MSLVLQACAIESCNGFTWQDRTGLYNATTNPDAYGPENDVESPADFDTYTLQVWLPGSDTSGDPDGTFNLLPPPTPDSDDYYSWEFTAADFGLTEIPYGFAYMIATGVIGEDSYSVIVGPLFTEALKADLKPVMDRWDPTCPKAGCQDPSKLYMALKIVQCDGVCSQVKATRVMDYIHNNIRNCC